MSATDAAREGARRRDGKFGTQRRSEPDPANAGLETPEAPLPTWEDALAHAEVLREQGVYVEINHTEHKIVLRDISGYLSDADDGTPAYQLFWADGAPRAIGRYHNGSRRDLPDGTPARQWFHQDGGPWQISHFSDGRLHDPADGTPAHRTYWPNGNPQEICHYTDGEFHDPADGTPARQKFYQDGERNVFAHYRNGWYVSEYDL